MGIRVVLFCAIASVMAVSILIVADLGNKKLEEDDVMVYTLINSHGIDKEVVAEAVENLNFHVLKKKFGIWKDVKHAIVDSLENKNPPVQFSGDDRVLKNRFNLFLELVNITPTRRILIQSVAGAPTQSPTISPTPAPSVKEPPRTSSSPSFFLADSTGPIDVKQSSSGPVSSGLELKKKKNSNKTVLIAVLVTAGSTFVVSVILLLCWRKFCGSGSITGRNDDRPLLGLSLSEYSHAYSKKSSFELNSTGNFEKKDSIQMFGIDSAINIPMGTVVGDVMVSSDNSVYNKMSANGLFPLKPPLGRANSTISTVVVPEKGSSSAPPPPPPPRPIAPPPPMPPSIPSKTSFTGPQPPPLPPRAAPVGSSKTAPRPPRPPPPTGGLKPPAPSAPSSSSSKGGEDETDVHKAKLKPFFWDKVLANPEQSMVWHQIKSGSFQFDEEMIETLFGYAPAAKTNDQSKNSSSFEPSNQYIQLLEPKKSQNISILLKALNVIIEEVVDALQEGHELPSELIQTLLKMGPTTDEELKLRLYSGDLSRLGPAERFLKHLVDLPFSFKKLEALHFMCTLKDEEKILKESFSILESACNELRKSRLFLKLLEAVLKTGNRMNNGTFRGGAQAFKLDTLLKLSDVKGVDGKTTLLHFVVQEIIRSEGVRAVRVARENLSMSGVTSDDNIHEDSSHETEEHYRTIGLQVVSGLCNELENVKRAAALDSDSISGSVSKLGHELIKARDLLNSELKNVDKESGFYQTLTSFVQNADVDIGWLLVEEKRIMGLVKNTGDYFHGNSAKDEGLRLFVVVRDFLIILEKACKEVKVAPNKPPSKAAQTMVAPSKQPLPPPPPPPDPDHRQRIIPALKQQRRMGDYSSDDDSP